MRVLIVASRYPWPVRRGDQVRSVQWTELLRLRHDVTLLVPEPARDAVPPPEAVAGALRYYPTEQRWRYIGLLRALLTGLPLQSGLFLQPGLRQELRTAVREADMVIVQLVRLAWVLDELGDVPLLVDFVDSLSLNFRQRARVDRGWRRPLLLHEARRLERYEELLVHRARSCAVVSERDRSSIARRLPAALEGRIVVVPVAVGSATESAPPPPEDAPPLAILSGNLGYFVNDDAVRWWMRSVWPQLQRRRPELRLIVAGSRPSSSLAKFLQRGGAELVASPPSMRRLLSRATVALAPLRCGSGVPMKVLEAWGVGTPIVVSPWAAAGTTGRPGRDFLVADSAREWADSVCALLEDGALRRSLAAAGKERLERDYGAEEVATRLEGWVGQLTASSPRRRKLVPSVG